MSLWRRVAIAVASAGGVGFFPYASGTVGSAVAVAAAWWAPEALSTQGLAVVLVTVLGLWASQLAVQGATDQDPSFVVIDEVAGMWLACLALPKVPWLYLAAFLLFRLFDIGKWFPMKQLEQLPGGVGIMADDLAAGALAWMVLSLWR
jgi:phosphatidylglycerophosphatase A